MYEFDSTVRYSEVDSKGQMTWLALMDYFQDCSVFHSESVKLGVEYRTTERYLGKPVYVRMINAGTFPSSGYKSVTISLDNLQQIIRATGSFKNSTRIPWGYDGNHLQDFYIESTRILLYSLNPGFTGDAYISVYYIKTTD